MKQKEDKRDLGAQVDKLYARLSFLLFIFAIQLMIKFVFAFISICILTFYDILKQKTIQLKGYLWQKINISRTQKKKETEK